jgi:hypothetical protein
MIGRGNRTTRRKPAPVPLCAPQTPHAARTRTRAAAEGRQRLTAELRHGVSSSNSLYSYDTDLRFVYYLAQPSKKLKRNGPERKNICEQCVGYKPFLFSNSILSSIYGKLENEEERKREERRARVVNICASKL